MLAGLLLAWLLGASWPAAMYGIVLLFAAIAYYILVRALIALDGHDSLLARAIGDIQAVLGELADLKDQLRAR